jgi:hypothetical protein
MTDPRQDTPKTDPPKPVHIIFKPNATAAEIAAGLRALVEKHGGKMMEENRELNNNSE